MLNQLIQRTLTSWNWNLISLTFLLCYCMYNCYIYNNQGNSSKWSENTNLL
jgi:hypothetical protein